MLKAGFHTEIRIAQKIQRGHRENRTRAARDAVPRSGGRRVTKQEICCSRMFGKGLRELEPIKEAVAAYAARASEKLRTQQSLCKRVRNSIRTGRFIPTSLSLRKAWYVSCGIPPTNPIHHPGGDRRFGAHLSRGLFVHQGRGPADGPVPARRVQRRFIRTNLARRVGARDGRARCNQRQVGPQHPPTRPRNHRAGLGHAAMSQSCTTRLDQLWVVQCN